MKKYKPLMSEKEVEKRRVWQEKVYHRLKKVKGKHKIKVLGKELIIVKGIFAPLFNDPIILAKAVKKEVKKDDVVLDLGTGSGIQGIFAADKARKVIAVDINSKALECMKLNSKYHRLDDKIRIFRSNLFSNIKEKFDLIIFNPPFRWFKPRDLMERGELDENYNTLTKFFKQVKNYLKKNGRILLVFANNGDLKYLRRLIKNAGFKSRTLIKSRKEGWDYYVYKLMR